RLVLARVAGATYVIVTPDRDVYDETYDAEHVVDFKQAGPRGGLPPGLGAARGQPVYRFANRVVGGERAALFREAEEMAAQLREEMGLALGEPGPEAEPGGRPPLPPPAEAPEEELARTRRADWKCVVESAAVKKGVVYSLHDHLDTPSEHFSGVGAYGIYDLGRRGESAIMMRLEPGQEVKEALHIFGARAESGGVAGGSKTPPAAAEDARTLCIVRDSVGRRFRTMRSAAESACLSDFDDWVLSGPRTTLYVVGEIAKMNGGPVQRHTTWKHENELTDEEHSVVAHEMLSEILELACTYDEVDVANLACLEALARHMQFIERKIKKKKETVRDFASQDYYLSRTRRTGGAIVSPELLKWAAESAARDSAILKEERKAAEERALARAPPKKSRSWTRLGLGRPQLVPSGRWSAWCLGIFFLFRRCRCLQPGGVYLVEQPSDSGDFCSEARPSEAQFSAVDMIWQAVSDDIPPSDVPSPEAALSELLGAETLGDGPEGSTVVAPFERGLVSWPESAGCAGLLDALPEPDYQEVLNGKHSLLLRADEVRPEPAKVYWDKTLRSDRGERANFVHELLRRNMVEDFVENLKRVYSEEEAEPGDALEVSIQDIAGCFYQFRVPDYMTPRFGTRPVRASGLGANVVEEQEVARGARVCPCLKALPMGLSWATRWTQQAHRELLRRGGLDGIESELVDRQVVSSVAAAPAPRAAHVDNEIFASNRAAATVKARRQAARMMASVGPPIREVEEGKNVVEALGLELDGIKLRARLAKRWRLVQGVRALLRRGRAAGREVEKMAGHFTHAMLLNRPALSALRSVCDFARKHYRHPAPLWPSVRRELANAMGLPPLPAAQFDLPWSGTATCSDATLRGYAAQEAKIDQRAVREVGRWSERWRFRVEQGWRQRAWQAPGADSSTNALRQGWRARAWSPAGEGAAEGDRRARRRPFCSTAAADRERSLSCGQQSGSWPAVLDGADRAKARPIGTGGLTALEQESATLKTKQDYERRLARFDDFCRIHGLEEPSNSGAKLLAAIGHRDPRLHHAGRLLKLPRMARALQGWRRLVPPVTRAPAPWAAVAAIAVALVCMDQRRAALGVVLAADAYLRPGELLSLRTHHVAPAQPHAGGDCCFTSLALRPEEESVATKTKGFNDSILLDSPSRSHLGPLVERLAISPPPMQLLFPWSGPAYNATFKEAAPLVGLASWELTPYILRHSGPSHDWLTKTRTLEAIKRRGRWVSDLSMRRYEKCSRGMRRLASIDCGKQLLLAEAEAQLEVALSSGQLGCFASRRQEVGLARFSRSSWSCLLAPK
ncbi:unnamed protein product, partial [Prorocentrum cordatum]